jgi:N-acylneuraminate cytidylyltransferase
MTIIRKKLSILIPARGGSRRIKNKNISTLGGKPLLSYVIAAASAVTDSVYVSTDDIKIENVAKLCGARIIKRPEEISGDYSKTEEVVSHFLESVDCDIFLVIQPTSPFVTSEKIKQAVGLLSADEFDSVVSVYRNFAFKWSFSGSPINFEIGRRPRTQDANHWYEENGAIYGTAKEIFLKTGFLYPGSVGFIEMLKRESIDIDTYEDLKLAEAFLSFTTLHDVLSLSSEQKSQDGA